MSDSLYATQKISEILVEILEGKRIMYIWPMVFAIIVAGGSGTRMKTEIPKQFCLLAEKPILYYSVRAFIDSFPSIKIKLVLPSIYASKEHPFLAPLKEFEQIDIIEGGVNRFESVLNGLNSIDEEHGIVFIHDAVRPFINDTLLQRCYTESLLKGNAIPQIAVKDSLRQITMDKNWAVDRNEYRAIQTPQTFKLDLIKKAFKQPYQEIFTDDASVLEADGEKINLVEGLDVNFKITTPIDLILAETMLLKKVTV